MTTDKIRKIALSLPHATEDIKWEKDLCFCIAAKMFCVTGLDQSPVSVSVKVAEDDFDDYCERPGIVPAPYVARYHWVLIEDSRTIPPKELDSMIRTSYRLVAQGLTKKQRRELNILD